MWTSTHDSSLHLSLRYDRYSSTGDLTIRRNVRLTFDIGLFTFHSDSLTMCYAAAYFSAPCDQISIIFRWMMEKSRILKSLFINLYVSPTNFDTETFFSQNNLFHNVAGSISDSIFFMSSHACCMLCRAGAE